MKGIEALELACFVLAINLDDEDTEEKLDDLIYEKFGIDFDQFSIVASALMPLTMVAESPLTKKIYQGFADTKNNMWLAKREIVDD